MFNNMSAGTRNTLVILTILLFIGIVAVLLNYAISQRAEPGMRRVRFGVEASGGFATITLKAGDTVIKDPTTVTVPWSKTVKVQSGTTVYLTAGNPSATGQLTCWMYLDTTKWKTETTAAPKNGVACAGIVP